MFKSILLPLFMALATLSGCGKENNVKDNSLISEIKSLPMPYHYNDFVIDYIVGNYIGKGLTREEIAVTLRRYGFSAENSPKGRNDPEFSSCENGVIIGLYNLTSSLPQILVYIKVGFNNNVSSVIRGHLFSPWKG